MVHRLADGFRSHAHVLQVSLSVDARGGPDRDEDELRVGQAICIGSGEAHTSGSDIAADHLFESRLVDGHAALAQGFDLALVNVDASHLVAQVGETCAGHEANIARADHSDVLHFSRLLLSKSPHLTP